MTAAFTDLPEALANSVAIAQRCNLTIPLGKNFLPNFPTPDGVTICSVLPLYFNYTGRSINGIGNIAFSYSGQSTAEITPTAGTG